MSRVHTQPLRKQREGDGIRFVTWTIVGGRVSTCQVGDKIYRKMYTVYRIYTVYCILYILYTVYTSICSVTISSMLNGKIPYASESRFMSTWFDGVAFFKFRWTVPAHQTFKWRSIDYCSNAVSGRCRLRFRVHKYRHAQIMTEGFGMVVTMMTKCELKCHIPWRRCKDGLIYIEYNLLQSNLRNCQRFGNVKISSIQGHQKSWEFNELHGSGSPGSIEP